MGFRKDLQGIRALAVMAVISFHVNSNWVGGGFVGVDIFFVISGFLITSIIFQKKYINTNFSFVQFYISRARRILPEYIVMLLATACIASYILLPEDYEYFYNSFLSALYFNSNVFFSDFGSYFSPSSDELPLLHTWSLGIEIKLYILAPFLIFLCSKKSLWLLLPFLFTLIFLVENFVLLPKYGEQYHYFSLASRSLEFIMGSWAALIASTKKPLNGLLKYSPYFGFALILLSVLFVSEEMIYPKFWFLFPCIGTVLLLLDNNNVVSDVLSSRELTWIGDHSYSLYLWHWPILAVFRYYLESYHIGFHYGFIAILLILLVSYLSNKFIRLTIGKIKSPSNVVASCSSLVVVCLICVFSLKTFNMNLVSVLPKGYRQYAERSTICHGNTDIDCIRGDKDSSYKILLIGDSHAAQLNYFSDVVGTINRQAITVVTASSCVTIPGFDVERLPGWAREPCEQQINWVMENIDFYDKIIVAGMWTYHTESQEFMKSLEKFFWYYHNEGKEIYVIGQIPLLSTDVKRFYRFEKIGFPKDIYIEKSYKKANTVIQSLTSKYENIRYIDFSWHPMFSEPPLYEGELIYSDESHLNVIGSTKYGNVAASVFLN